MKRRSFITTGTLGALAVGLTTIKPLKAQAIPAHPLIESTISRNHGHTLELDAHSLIKHMHESFKEDVLISIEGDSSHPHDIVLTKDNLLTLLENKTLTVESSEDAGHIHRVTIKLVL